MAQAVAPIAFLPAFDPPYGSADAALEDPRAPGVPKTIAVVHGADSPRSEGGKRILLDTSLR